jgi:hypothetical protein
MRRPARAVRRAITALVVPLLVLTACGDPDTETLAESDGSAPEGATTLGPGTRINEDFVVPAAAELLLWPVPVSAASPSQGWAASMTTSDAVAVINDLAEQAEAAGFEPQADAAPTCEDTETVVLESDGGAGVWCSTVGYRRTDAGTEELVLSSIVGRGPTAGEDTATASIAVRPLAPGGQISVVPPVSSPGQRFVPGQSGVEPAVPDQAPPELEPGELLAPRFEERLVEGSQLVVAVVDERCQGGLLATLEVTGDPDRVFDAYVEQMAAWAEEYGNPPEVTEGELFGRRVVEAYASVDGVPYFARMAVGEDDEPTRLELDLCAG